MLGGRFRKGSEKWEQACVTDTIPQPWTEESNDFVVIASSQELNDEKCFVQVLLELLSVGLKLLFDLQMLICL